MEGLLEIVRRGVEEGKEGRADGKEGTREDGWREGKQEGRREEGWEQVRRGNKAGGGGCRKMRERGAKSKQEGSIGKVGRGREEWERKDLGEGGRRVARGREGWGEGVGEGKVAEREGI